MRTILIALLFSAPAFADSPPAPAPEDVCLAEAMNVQQIFDGENDQAWRVACEMLERHGHADCVRAFLLSERVVPTERAIPNEKNAAEKALIAKRAARGRLRATAKTCDVPTGPVRMGAHRPPAPVITYCKKHDPARGKRPGKAIVTGCGKDVVLAAAYHCVEACPK